jgi:hypothetical protein
MNTETVPLQHLPNAWPSSASCWKKGGHSWIQPDGTILDFCVDCGLPLVDLDSSHLSRLDDIRYHGWRSTDDTARTAELDFDLQRARLVTIREGRLGSDGYGSEPLYVTEPVGCWHPRRPM